MTDEIRGTGSVERVEPVEHTHIGGQAVIEGVMMRGKYNWAVAVRQPNGEIHCEAHDLGTVQRKKWLSWPVVRGSVALYDTVALAMKAIGISASYSGETEEEQLSEREVGFVMIFGVILAVALFIVLPYVITNLLVPGGLQTKPFAWNLVDGILRLLVLFGYIFAISRMKDVKRLFSYHGAEHKTIHAYEHGVPLEPKQVQQFGTAHVRCGTSFLLMVMLVALIVYMLLPLRAILAALGVTNKYMVQLLSLTIRILFLPVIAGLAYEVIRYAGRHENTGLVKVLLWPGMQLQRMTTNEPDDSMVEVAIASVKPIIAREEAEAAGTYVPGMILGGGDVEGAEPTEGRSPEDMAAAAQARRAADERDDIVGAIDA